MMHDYLKTLLPELQRSTLAERTNPSLVSLAKAYAALCRLVSFHAPEAGYCDRDTCFRKIDALFHVLSARCGGEPDTVLRARMIRAMFTLVVDTVPAVDFTKRCACCSAADTLIGDYLKTSDTDPLKQAAVCQCLTDLLYPGPDADNAYYLYLQECIAAWASSMPSDGRWPGIPEEVALERIDVMNRNSFMLLDKRFDEAICRAFRFYNESVRIPIGPGSLYPDRLPLLGRLYDAATLGNAYRIDTHAAARIATFMFHYSLSAIDRGDDWFYSTSYVVHHVCEELAARMQPVVSITA